MSRRFLYPITTDSRSNFSMSSITAANVVSTSSTVSSILITNGSLRATFNANTLGNIFTTGGNVGVGTSSPSYTLHVDGYIYATSEIAAFSDARKKEDVVSIENALEKVHMLRGVYYTNSKTTKRGIGVIAQEIERVLPEVVLTDAEGFKSVAYGNIVGVLIEAVKELSMQNTELNAKNRELCDRVTNLERKCNDQI